MHKAEELVRPYTVPVTFTLSDSSKEQLLSELETIPDAIFGFDRKAMLRNGNLTFSFSTSGGYLPVHPSRFHNSLFFSYTFKLSQAMESESFQVQLPGGLPKHVSLTIIAGRYPDEVYVWQGPLPTSRSKPLSVEISLKDEDASNAESGSE